MKKLFSLIGNLLQDIKTHWRTPADKKYIPYREMAAYSVGGVGVYAIVTMVGLIAMNAGSMIVGASIGIKAVDLQTMNVVSTLIALVFSPFRAMMFDNTRSKMGKFRPYLLYMGLPTAFFATLFVFLPYENMEYNQKVISVFVIYTILQFFSPLYSSAYSNLVQVLSPNSQERAWTIEVSSIIYSFAPTVINPVVPLLGGLDNIQTYRLAFPIFCTIGVIVSFLCVFGTKEKIIVPKQYVQKVSFFDGLRKVSKNKYFWIINGSTWLGFLANGYSYLFPWIFYYGMNRQGMYSIMTIIKGEASTPGMLLGAPLSNKLGKKRVCFISLVMQVICLVLMLVCYKSYVMIFIMMFIKDIFSSLAIIYLPAMKADVIDYQQYKTGDRLEGFIDQSGVLLGSVITLATGYALPLVFRSYGLTNNYDDLYNADFRNPIIYATLICSIIGTVLSIIPFFFYDLSEYKRSNMIKVLKIRAVFDNAANGIISDEDLKEMLSAVKEAELLVTNRPETTDKKVLEEFECAKITVDEFERQKQIKPDVWEKLNANCIQNN